MYGTYFRRSLRTQGITVKMCGYKVERRVLSVTKFKWAGNRGNYRLIHEKFVVCTRVLVLRGRGNEEECSGTNRRLGWSNLIFFGTKLLENKQ